MPNKDLDALFLHTLKDVNFAENAIVKALPKMAKAATDKKLQKAFETHLKQTKGHVDRLEQVFKLTNRPVQSVPCEAIKGILKEGDEVAEEFAGGMALDAGLIAAAQAVEHYEIARYGALHAWAEQLGYGEAAALLSQTLEEEKETDELLTGLAAAVNAKAEA